MYGRAGRIGIIVLDSDLTIEPDLRRLLPEGVEIHAARVSYPRRVTPENLEIASKHAVAAVDQLLPVRPAAIAWACTSGSFYAGLQGNEALTAQLQAAAGDIPVTTASGAVRAALSALEVGHPAVGTPYSEEVTRRLGQFLEDCGTPPASILRLHAKDLDDFELQDVTPDTLADFITRLAATEGSDSVVLSCTGLATGALVPEIEPELGKPVITSNLAILWHCWQLGGIGPMPMCDCSLMRTL